MSLGMRGTFVPGIDGGRGKGAFVYGSNGGFPWGVICEISCRVSYGGGGGARGWGFCSSLKIFATKMYLPEIASKVTLLTPTQYMLHVPT